MLYATAFLAALAAFNSFTEAATKPKNSVLLSNVKTLTVYNGKETSHRRVSALPQLNCIGGNGRGLFEVDVMRCKNQGSDYDDDSIQWSCTASLPPEFKLGSTEVICEGYDSPDDPYILKGSCGVEYRLVLTDAGEAKYGQRRDTSESSFSMGKEGWTISSVLFFMLFGGVALLMIVNFVRTLMQNRGQPRHPRAPRAPGWGGGYGGGGDDPPPPYDPYPPSSKPRKTYQKPSQGAWQPGFWSGAAGGAAAGAAASYLAGGRRSGSGNGEGSSRGSSSSATPSSSRYTSTGFGGTSRR
ncbi:DUF1183-domain-containing protein [Aulographum hederae CBS 113979]|uniref:Store-operated calcium entry-associated regulatory factor n=1 Tax=Aulographum hederae CBS 113979 TaxID=1176131 RepID=A0A6G1GKG2_9PEZI|nr:DUF1183-domain-containing protein [Aulographum hederae CBS 113979]